MSLQCAEGDSRARVESSTELELRPFTDQEKRALRNDGAVIYSLTGETIEYQEGKGRKFWYITTRQNRLLKSSSLKGEVAFYPDPKRFFIPNSGNKDLPTQEELAKEDTMELRERLGLKDGSLSVVIPFSAATFTQLIFKHLDETTKQGKGVWLFGPDYAAAQGLSFVYGRTKNPVNESGSNVALVGDCRPVDGVHVSGWNADNGLDSVHVVRLVVAAKKSFRELFRLHPWGVLR